MLNAYGAVEFAEMADGKVWRHSSQPLATGAVYGSEFCSKEADRRGVDIIRWLHTMVVFCKCQKEEVVMMRNTHLMKGERVQELVVFCGVVIH